jgi:tetratricopeptide (TPR) repeat protein
LEKHRTAEAQKVLERLLAKKEPLDGPSRLLLANLCLRMGDLDLAGRWLELPPGEDDSAARHLLRGVVLSADQRQNEGLEEFRKAARLDPDYRDPAQRIYRDAVSRGFENPAAAVDACRNLLRIDPYQAETHAMLAQLYWRIGDEDSAERHEKYVSLLAPKRQ